MTYELWLVYLAAAVGLSLTPGPNGLLSLTHGACYGFRPTVSTVLGGALGFFLLIAISLAGFGTLLAASERAFLVAKWIGAAYLVYLGIRVWRSAPPDFGAATCLTRTNDLGTYKMFQQGFLVAVSNPKGLLFFAAFLPQFMVAGSPFLLQLAVFGGTFVLVEVVYELLLARFAQRIAPWLARSGRWFNRITGGAFVGIGSVLASASK